MITKLTKNIILEWFGVLTAILYSMLIALNIGAEFIGFLLLLISAISIAIWSYRNNFKSLSQILDISYLYSYNKAALVLNPRF